MPLALYTCLLWLSTSGLWTIQAEDPDAAISTKSPHRDLAPINADFAFSLYKHLVASAPDRNTFISPVSISMALAMLSLGAGGHTRSQLLQGLGFNLTEISEGEIHQSFQNLYHLLRESDTGLEMTMDSTLHFGHNLEPLDSFLEDIKHYYGSEALTVELQEQAATSRQINAYIQNQTQGKPADTLSDLDSPAVPTLVNYIFSKGTASSSPLCLPRHHGLLTQRPPRHLAGILDLADPGQIPLFLAPPTPVPRRAAAIRTHLGDKPLNSQGTLTPGVSVSTTGCWEVGSSPYCNRGQSGCPSVCLHCVVRRPQGWKSPGLQTQPALGPLMHLAPPCPHSTELSASSDGAPPGPCLGPHQFRAGSSNVLVIKISRKTC